MGLAEKRWAADRKKSDDPAFRAQVNSTLGFEVPIEIDWDKFSESMDDAAYITSDSYGLPNLVKALATITADDLGKEAIKGALKKITIQSAKTTRRSRSRTARSCGRRISGARVAGTSTPT